MCNMLNIVNFIICVATFGQTIDSSLAVKRGPHHPRSEQSKTRKVDQHLAHEEHHIDDDLKEMGISANLNEMTEEEKNFYYFKIFKDLEVYTDKQKAFPEYDDTEILYHLDGSLMQCHNQKTITIQ